MIVPPDGQHLWQQIVWLFVLAAPIACIAWTVTHEEIFKEPREYCKQKSEQCRALLQRKIFYLFTCEYCFSHWVTVLFLLLTRFKLLMDNWVGYVISFFALVFVANVYMSLYSHLRVDITNQRVDTEVKEKEVEETERRIEKLG